MRIILFILLMAHSLIHLLGFIKGFGIKEIKTLTLPISKSMGTIWLLTSIILFVFAVLYFIQYKYDWLLGFLGLLFSQFLIFYFWKDAKAGTVMNVIVLLLSILSLGQFFFQEMVNKETKRLMLASSEKKDNLITLEQLSPLPLPIQNWLKHIGALNQPFMYAGKVTQEAQMKLKPEQKNWYTAEAEQYSFIDEPSFIWSVNVKMNPLIFFKGRDKFENGKGEMLIKLNSLIPIVHEKGVQIDEGSLQRFLGEMVWFPSLALSPYIEWEQLDSKTVKATMNYQGTSGSGTFHFNEDGDVAQFSALRFKGNESSSKRYEWILSVEEHHEFEGIRVPSKMTATWKLEDTDWTWLKLEIKDIDYNSY